MPKPDMEVEQILSDIRRQVLHDNGTTGNTPRAMSLAGRQNGSDASEIRIQTYLKATDQLRGSLPPVRSYRGGAKAKIELWIKQKIKRATKWFFFDQVNFNSTVHELLSELHAAQVRQQQLFSEFQRVVELEARERDHRQNAINDAQDVVNDEQRRFNDEQRSVNCDQGLINEQLRSSNEVQRSVNQDQSTLNERQSAAIDELRSHLSESAVVIDRLRRNFEHRLTTLEKDRS